MVIESQFYTQLMKEIRMRVSQEAVETIHDLVALVEQLQPDSEYADLYGIDEVLEQAKLTVQKLTKEGE
jgi:hypothetical protein